MANFKVKYFSPSGYTGYVSFDLLEKNMTPDDKLAILRPGAEILLKNYRSFLAANTHDRNADVRGRLAESLRAEESPVTGWILVGPHGVHHGHKARRKRAEGYRRARTGQGRGRTNPSRHHGLTSGVSAADVGYYLEYGTPRMAALHWMETVNDESDAEVQAALEAAWDAHLQRLGF